MFRLNALLLTALFFLGLTSSAQDNHRIEDINRGGNYIGPTLTSKDLLDPRNTDPVYFKDAFQDVEVVFINGYVDTLQSTFEIRNQVLEVEIDDTIKLVPSSVTRRFSFFSWDERLGEMTKETFHNINHYYESRDKSLRFPELAYYQLVVEGEVALWKTYSVKVKSAAASKGQQYTSGRGDSYTETIFKIEHFHICDGKNLIEVPRGKAKAIATLRKAFPNIADVVAENKINFRKESSLIVLVNLLSEK